MQVDVLLEPETQKPKSQDRVRASTPVKANQRIDREMVQRVWEYSRKPREEITARIEELDREWDIERALETKAGVLALSGLVLSVFKGRKWLALPAAVLAAMLQHSITRSSPPVHLLRTLGFRTRREIDAEKNALRMLRGDFDSLNKVSEGNHRAIEALRLNRS